MNSLNESFLTKGFFYRNEYHQLLFSAIQAESQSFSRRLAHLWLEKYPGDLEIQYILARILANENDISEARRLLERIAEIDPEFIEAQELLAKICVEENNHPSIDALACVYVMGRTIYTDFKIPDWSFLFRTAWQAYLANHFEDSEMLIRQVIVQKPRLALAAILHHKVIHAKGDLIASEQLLKIYHERFPQCLYFTLLLADSMMMDGNDIPAVEMLQECATKDSLGLVAGRIWGSDHRYLSLWPDRYEIQLDMTVPAEVISFLGLNNLPEGEKLLPEMNSVNDPPEYFDDGDTSDGSAFRAGPHRGSKQKRPVRTPVQGTEENTIQAVDEIFERLSKKLKQPDLSRSDGRYPVYVVLSLKTKLIQKYGKQTFLLLDTEIQNLASAVRSQLGWGVAVIYPDDPVNMIGYGLTAIDQTDPWKIKNVLVDLDRVLSKKGEMIGSLLIIGSSDVVPHHRLPNPTDDLDEDVASDNPYAAIDGNYFVQEWPVGRFPDEKGGDAGFLLSQIRFAIANHAQKSSPPTILQRLAALFRLFKTNARSRSKGINNLGYSAAIWQNASRSVFKSIGSGQKLFTSPPEYSGTIQPRRLSASRLSYFNLHGLQDSAEWYGQKEPGDQETHADYPIALSPKEISKNGAAPEIVISEACYGGHVSGKNEDNSIALKYMGIGVGVFIGSTCVSYGSIDNPLIGADLLAQLIWRNILTSASVGEAFVHAKLDFVREMDRRQGFLDGEDQKTLLSFVYYGDPLFAKPYQNSKTRRTIRRISSPKINLLSEDEDMASFETEIAASTIQEVKKIAEIYLPGLEDVNIHIMPQQMIHDSGAGSERSSGTKGSKNIATDGRGQTVITVSKAVPENARIHYHYLRARFNKDGDLQKMAISR